jgi:tetratricopeptide (TPR) repeat protein
MGVSVSRRLIRDRLIREAEGSLELMMACADLWELDPAARDPIGERVLRTLLRLEPQDRRNAHVWYLQGLAYRAMERHDDAIAPLQEAAEVDPENMHVWLTLGWCYKRTGRLPLAIEALNEALAIDPRQAIVHYNLACYWSLSGQSELALEHLGIAFDLDADYRELATRESDFDPLRNDPSFLELTSVIC